MRCALLALKRHRSAVGLDVFEKRVSASRSETLLLRLYSPFPPTLSDVRRRHIVNFSAHKRRMELAFLSFSFPVLLFLLSEWCRSGRITLEFDRQVSLDLSTKLMRYLRVRSSSRLQVFGLRRQPPSVDFTARYVAVAACSLGDKFAFLGCFCR